MLRVLFAIAAMAATSLLASAQDALIHAGKLLAVPGEGYLTEQTNSHP